MKVKSYSPVVLDAVADSLRTAYWYKPDLRSFLGRAGVPEATLAQLPWDGYKREVVRVLLDGLAANPATGKPILDKIIGSLVEQDDRFPHLRRLDDGVRKVEDAQRAVRHLKDLLGQHTVVERAEEARQEARTEARRQVDVRQARQRTLDELNKKFIALASVTDKTGRLRRGFEFQALLRDLFALHDLDPRGGFARPGEQTDGSITIDGTVLLVEAKWTEAQSTPSEVRDFRVKVHDKLDNTLGLMISMSGFTEDAVNAAAGGGRMLVILMDGVDLARVFQGLDDIVDVLRRKLRHAAEKGEALYRAGS